MTRPDDAIDISTDSNLRALRKALDGDHGALGKGDAATFMGLSTEARSVMLDALDRLP